MRRLLAGLALASAAVAGRVRAQEPTTEFGVDLGIKWRKSSGGGSAVLQIQTPVDVRVAFFLPGRTAFEPRFTALFLSVAGRSVYSLDPGLNVLMPLPGGTYNRGGYLTAGVDVAISGGSGLGTGAAYTLNLGPGLRRPLGRAAVRGEAFVGYTPKQGTTVPEGYFTLGARLGLSFFD